MTTTIQAPKVAVETASLCEGLRKATPPAGRRSPYIAGPVYDWVFFLLSPTLALLIGWGLASTWLSRRPFLFHGQIFSASSLFIGILIHAHLLAVVFRSHGRPEIRRRHRIRFLVVPVLLYAVLVSSTWALVCASVLATFWDVYHSGLQTFGLARIYGAKAGNGPAVGRRLDWWLNTLLYAGPVVAGATMLDHFKDFREFEAVGSALLTSVPAFMESQQRYFTWSALALGTAFVAYYVWAWSRLHRQGHAVSVQKVFLLASTGLVSVYTWGFNSFGMAFFIMNFFHAVQYLALVWWSEKKHIMRAFSVERSRRSVPLGLCFFLMSTCSYGYFVEALDTSIISLWAITLVVSLMHFWYDGFIWSVRRADV